MPTKAPSVRDEIQAFLAAQPHPAKPIAMQLLHQIMTCLLQAESAEIDRAGLLRLANAQVEETLRNIQQVKREQTAQRAIENPGELVRTDSCGPGSNTFKSTVFKKLPAPEVG